MAYIKLKLTTGTECLISKEHIASFFQSPRSVDNTLIYLVGGNEVTVKENVATVKKMLGIDEKGGVTYS